MLQLHCSVGTVSNVMPLQLDCACLFMLPSLCSLSSHMPCWSDDQVPTFP
jgi:hypothetical protein